MTTIIDWPANLKPASATIPYLERQFASGGVSTSGIERFVANDSGRWRYAMRVPVVGGDWKNKLLSWRAFMAQSEGRGNLIRVPICDCKVGLAATSGANALNNAFPSGLPYSDGKMHSDGTGYSGSLVIGTVTAAAAAGATSISVTLPVGVVPQPGHFFSDGSRLYIIKSADVVTGTTYLLRFLPRLRAAIPAGAELSFDRLFCIMRLADEGLLRTELELMRFTELNLDFVESF